MDKERLRKELHEKVNAWFDEKPQRTIVQFMLDTMFPYIEAAQQGVNPTSPEQDPIYNLKGKTVARGHVVFDKPQSG